MLTISTITNESLVRERNLAVAFGKLDGVLNTMKNRYPEQVTNLREAFTYKQQEFDDIWDAIKSGSMARVQNEAIEAAATILLMVADCMGDQGPS